MRKSTVKRLSFLLTAVFVFTLFPAYISYADAFGVSIDETNFPDEVFRQYVSNTFDLNSDGYLSDTEAMYKNDEYYNQISIKVSSLDIQSLKGIEYFTYLDRLDCSNNQLTELDLSSLLFLKELDISNNQLEEVKINTSICWLFQTYSVQDKLVQYRPGSEFDGWYIDEACSIKFDSTTAYTNGSVYSIYSKWTDYSYEPGGPIPDVTPTPTASPVDTYTVSFDSNGHGTAPESQELNYGDVPIEPDEPTAVGWLFDGWYTDVNCTEAYNFDFEVTSDITLYAKWIESDTCTVTFDTNGNGTAPIAQVINCGDVATKPSDPTSSGFVFDGWYVDEVCSEAFDFGTAITEDTTIYAKWIGYH